MEDDRGQTWKISTGPTPNENEIPGQNPFLPGGHPSEKLAIVKGSMRSPSFALARAFVEVREEKAT
eukprot:731423-Lingulodinium_polyedra.AAC.1